MRRAAAEKEYTPVADPRRLIVGALVVVTMISACADTGGQAEIMGVESSAIREGLGARRVSPPFTIEQTGRQVPSHRIVTAPAGFDPTPVTFARLSSGLPRPWSDLCHRSSSALM
jgi:hypothetical protein